jgi:hypothetical protein
MRSLSWSLMIRTVCLAVLVGVPANVGAQVIGLKTTPLAAGDQFAIAPSRNAGMAGASIALDDWALDPFVNPAMGVRVAESQFFSAPVAYDISDENGGARTLPVGVLLSSTSWFGGAVAAMQQVDRGRMNRLTPWRVDQISTVVLPAVPWREESPTNKYFQLTLGRRLGESGLALGASAMAADLNGTDGVEELFANAWLIDEFGRMEDYRLGLTGSLSGDRTFEVVLVHNRVNLTQDVTSVSWTLTDSAAWAWSPEVTQEANQNRTRTWGAHVGYVQPIGSAGWRLGGILTANRKLHPKIPTYDLANVVVVESLPIPRDPGESWAYNVGLGLSRQAGPTTFAMDLVYEPAVSDTWADAESDVTTADGGTIPAGARTVDNRFIFSNARVNVGVTREIGTGAIQLGVRAHHYDYRLRQDDHVRMIRRSQTEQWTEWTPTWGFRVTWSSVELRYAGSASSASHFPWLGGRSVLEVDSPVDVLAPPTGALRPPDETTVTHRLALSIPIR